MSPHTVVASLIWDHGHSRTVQPSSTGQWKRLEVSRGTLASQCGSGLDLFLTGSSFVFRVEASDLWDTFGWDKFTGRD